VEVKRLGEGLHSLSTVQLLQQDLYTCFAEQYGDILPPACLRDTTQRRAASLRQHIHTALAGQRA